LNEAIFICPDLIKAVGRIQMFLIYPSVSDFTQNFNESFKFSKILFNLSNLPKCFQLKSNVNGAVWICSNVEIFVRI